MSFITAQDASVSLDERLEVPSTLVPDPLGPRLKDKQPFDALKNKKDFFSR